MNLRHFLKQDRGSIYLEVLIAIIFISIALPSLISLYSLMTQSSYYSQHRFEALAIANEQLETLKLYEGDSKATFLTRITEKIPLSGERGGNTYTIDPQIIITTDPYLTPVKIIVRWEEFLNGKTQEKTVELTSYYYHLSP